MTKVKGSGLLRSFKQKTSVTSPSRWLSGPWPRIGTLSRRSALESTVAQKSRASLRPAQDHSTKAFGTYWKQTTRLWDFHMNYLFFPLKGKKADEADITCIWDECVKELWPGPPHCHIHLQACALDCGLFHLKNHFHPLSPSTNVKRFSLYFMVVLPLPTLTWLTLP